MLESMLVHVIAVVADMAVLDTTALHVNFVTMNHYHIMRV